jgi:Zn-dependent M28 family amino/carboxypeptidase
LIGEYEVYQDFTPLVRDYAGPGEGSGHVAWADECEHDEFDELDVVGGIVICHYLSFEDQARQALEHGAAALLLMIDPQERSLDFAIPLRDAWLAEPLPTFWVSPEVVGDLLQGSGRSLDTLSMDNTPGALTTRVSFEVEVAHEEACPSAICWGRNVLGILPGRDPEYADEIVIIGGHFDHMGQGPDGTFWPGANDDASGIAVFLEIARSWHEQGYVPRRSVLFAAWDAEEQGLLGSRHYVANPRLPLENTLAMIQLDMVGIGGEEVFAAGRGLIEEITAAAEAYELEVFLADGAGSDHVPFLEAGIPAAILSWNTGERIGETYHRTSDVPAAIELEYLEWTGKITEMVVLGIVDAELALQDLVAARQNALQSNDLEAFLATSSDDLLAADALWFEDFQSLSPSGIEIGIDDITLSGSSATAEVRYSLSFESEGEEIQPPPVARTCSMLARFEFDEGWGFAGPELVWAVADPEQQVDDGPVSTFSIAYPVDREFGALDFAQQVAEDYAEIAALLGLPEAPAVDMILFPDGQTLRASTALSQLDSLAFWVGQGTVKIRYSSTIAESGNLQIALSRLVLAEAGVNEEAAPWLWRGLSLAVDAERERASLYSTYQPRLQRALAEGEEIQPDVAAWAAVEYLLERLGWDGLGNLIRDIGQACAYRCEGTEGADEALMRAIGVDSEAFEAVWQSDWRMRLDRAQRELDAVLANRQDAILSGNLDAFLNSVDPTVPYLRAEERSWFEGLADAQIDQLAITGTPVALLNDGQLLAKVLIEYSLVQEGQDLSSGRPELEVVFTPGGQGLLWSGVLFEELLGERVQVRFPSGKQELAAIVLDQAETILRELDGRLGLRLPQEVVIKLYEENQEFRHSILPSFPSEDRFYGWTEPGTSLKLLHWQTIEPDSMHPTLTRMLIRHVLADWGVSSEWLLKGLSVHLASEVDGGASGRRAAQYLRELLSSSETQELSLLAEMPPDHAMPAEQVDLAYAYAWDTVRYLIDLHGEYPLRTLLAWQRSGATLVTSFEPAIGISLSSFETDWAQSLALGHAREEWVDLALRFNAMEVQDHITYLASRMFAGRQAGTPGAVRAAEYIAQEFAAYGLLPAGDILSEDLAQDEGSSNQQEIQSDSHSYLQRFPIEFSTLLLNPQLLVFDDQSQAPEVFIYQRDFILVPEVIGSGGDVQGELIWVHDGTYEDMNLEGAIVVRQPHNPLIDEVTRAVDHGAGGLILVGFTTPEHALAKAAIPHEPLLEAPIPVLELTDDGFERLLQITGQTRHNLNTSPPALSLEMQVQMQVLLSQPQIVDSANVLGLLPGADPSLADEVIILGAHYDHVGDNPGVKYCLEILPSGPGLPEEVLCDVPSGRRYPGANDNASGIGVLLEIARLWHENGYRPNRSVLFAAWGAQEIGEVGSSFYVQNPVFSLESTLAVVQLDAVGGGSGFYLEVNFDWEREAELVFTITRAEEAVDGRLAKVTTIADGDHLPFREAGVPTLPLSWRGASEENMPQGYEDEIELYRLSVTGRMVTLTLMTLAR